MTGPRKLDFLIAGAEKCGTTWLADVLRPHPEIFIPAEKEIHYFNRKFSDFPEVDNYNFDKPLEWYFRFFAGASAGQKVGEACPAYLWDEAAAARIQQFQPDLNIVIVLRNPVERTYSAYRFWMQRGVVGRMPFRKAVQRFNTLLLERSMYFAQVKRYYDLFPKERVRIWLMDGVKGDALARLLEQVEDYLGVSRFIPPNINTRSNVTGDSRFWMAGWVMARVRRFIRQQRIFDPILDRLRERNVAQRLEDIRINNKTNAKPTQASMMDAADRQWLVSLLQDDIRKLQDLTGMDLSAWK